MEIGLNPPYHSSLCETEFEVYKEYLSRHAEYTDKVLAALSSSARGGVRGGCVDDGVAGAVGFGRGVADRVVGAGVGCRLVCATGVDDGGKEHLLGADDGTNVGGNHGLGAVVDDVSTFGGGIDDGGSCVGVNPVVRGKHYEKNRAKKERAKANRERLRLMEGVAGDCAGPWRSGTVQRLRELKEKGSYFSELPADDRAGLKESYAQRLRAENELKCFQAQRRLELEKAKDFGQMKKRQETYLMSQTEMNKVRAEKAFATLAQTDNVPGVVGSARTVASSGGSSGNSPVFSGVGSGTISPNSSISLAEIHALQKRELENAHKVEKLEARLEKLKLLQPDMYKELGFLHALPPTVGTGVTVDENGDPVGDYGDGFAGYLGDDGRFHFGENYDNY